LTYLERQKSYGPDKLRWEKAEVEEKIRLKQYVSLRSKGRHNNTSKIGLHLIITLHVSIYINIFFYNNAIKHFFYRNYI
jgi:hypothetical protein